MHEECFVFGSKVELARRDAITSLPLEICWKIFSYLDKASLVCANNTCKLWRRIIVAHKKLVSRINKFNLSNKLGSNSLAKFLRRNKKILKKAKSRNYVPTAPCTVASTSKTVFQSKRGGEDIVVYTKRYKLF